MKQWFPVQRVMSKIHESYEVIWGSFRRSQPLRKSAASRALPPAWHLAVRTEPLHSRPRKAIGTAVARANHAKRLSNRGRHSATPRTGSCAGANRAGSCGNPKAKGESCRPNTAHHPSNSDPDGDSAEAGSIRSQLSGNHAGDHLFQRPCRSRSRRVRCWRSTRRIHPAGHDRGTRYQGNASRGGGISRSISSPTLSQKSARSERPFLYRLSVQQRSLPVGV